MADVIYSYAPCSPITFTATADITGGTLVEVSGPMSVAPASANSAKTVGVAAFDAKSGGKVTVLVCCCAVPMIASAAITAGDLLVAVAGGKVATRAAQTAEQIVGVALTGAAAANATLTVLCC